MTEQNKRHRAGFVNIIGNPNVGKSTLMNALVGEKLSIVTAKAQTTRHRIMGIVNGDDYQIVYSDTPGILKPNYRLQQSMMNFVDTAIGDADIILYVTDTVEKGDKNEEYIAKLKKIQCPVVLVINKIDISTQDDGFRKPSSSLLPHRRNSISTTSSTRLSAIFQWLRLGTTRMCSQTRTCVSSLRRLSARRFSSTIRMKFHTAVKWRSRNSRRERSDMTSAR